MELYKLLSTTEIPIKHNRMQKEWQVRIKNGLNYLIQVIYNQNFDDIVVKINNCIVESVTRNILILPIIIEDLEFEVHFTNGMCRLYINHQDIEMNKELQNIPIQLSLDELTDILIKSESVISSGENQELQERIRDLKLQIEILQNAYTRTDQPQYISLIQEQITTLNFFIESLEQNRPRNQYNIPPPSDIKITFLSNYKQSINSNQEQHFKPKNGSQEQPQADIKQPSSVEDEKLCVVCQDKPCTHAPVPCGHLRYCEDCVKYCVSKQECFLCKQKITGCMKIYN